MMTEEKADIEAAFSRSASVADLDPHELEIMCRAIRHIVQQECDTTVQSIHVMGSFARGDAMEVASDIDLRIVCSEVPAEDPREQCEQRLKVEQGPRIRPSICGYIDARLSSNVPADDEPSVLVWARDL